MAKTIQSEFKSIINTDWICEELTIPVGQGGSGVNTTIQVPNECDVIEVSAVVSKSPGGGALTFNLARTSNANVDEFLSGISTTLNTSASKKQGDGDNTPMPIYNSAADTLVLTTNNNVTISEMKVKLCIYYRQYIKPSN